MATSQSVNIKTILVELGDEDFKLFKFHLSEDERIPKRILYPQLEKLDRLDTSAKINQTYGADSLKYMMGVLEEIDRNDLVEKFSRAMSTPTKRKEKKEHRRKFCGTTPSSSNPVPTRRPNPSKVHHGLICEGCEESIIGTRFKCTLCPDYDLCSDCQSTGRHKKHPLLAIQDPAQGPVMVHTLAGKLRSLKLEDQASMYQEKELMSVRNEFIQRVSEPTLNTLLDQLLDKKVITDEEMDSAMGKLLRAEKAREIIDMVRRKGNKASSTMIDLVHQLDPTLSELLWL